MIDKFHVTFSDRQLAKRMRIISGGVENTCCYISTLRAMIFRRLCTPKKNNDAMLRLIFFGAEIHSESHGPMRRFLVDRVLVWAAQDGSCRSRHLNGVGSVR